MLPTLIFFYLFTTYRHIVQVELGYIIPKLHFLVFSWMNAYGLAETMGGNVEFHKSN